MNSTTLTRNATTGFTFADIVVFTALTLFGIEELKRGWLVKYERGLLGGLASSSSSSSTK